MTLSAHGYFNQKRQSYPKMVDGAKKTDCTLFDLSNQMGLQIIFRPFLVFYYLAPKLSHIRWSRFYNRMK